MKETLVEYFGWYGTIAILAAFALLSFGVIEARGVPYQALNATGALGIIAVSLKKKAYQPAALNVAWLAIAIIAILTAL